MHNLFCFFVVLYFVFLWCLILDSGEMLHQNQSRKNIYFVIVEVFIVKNPVKKQQFFKIIKIINRG